MCKLLNQERDRPIEKTIFLSLNPIVNGVGGGKFNPPLPDFFNNFISLKVRA